MMYKITNYFLLFTLLSLLSCRSDSDTINIRDYYFPMKQLTEGLVYEYEPIQSPTNSPVYWYYRSFLKGEEKYLTGTYYEAELYPLQFIRETMVKNGMLLEDIYIYSLDSIGNQKKIPVEILAGNSFPFEVRDSGGIFLYKISWLSELEEPMQTTLIKNRRYVGETKRTYNGKEYDCIVFDVKELFEVEQEGFLEQEFDGTEVYAKGLGLIYYKKVITESLVLEYQLKDTYPMARLEEAFRMQIQKQ